MKKKSFRKKGKKNIKKILLILVIAAVLVISILAIAAGKGWIGEKKNNSFVGSCFQLGMQKYGFSEQEATDWCGPYLNDKLVMKWNEEWNRGTAENWLKPPYDAWETNEWNGAFTGGSGQVWHYKIKWVGPCGQEYDRLPDGGYCIWSQFETVMDQGVSEGQHTWLAHANPTGYVIAKKK